LNGISRIYEKKSIIAVGVTQNRKERKAHYSHVYFNLAREEGGVMLNIDDYRIHQATHNLQCSHCIGNNRINYIMKCIPIGKITRSGKIRVLVFGDRYWSGRDHRRHVRYVDRYRLSLIK
jgi:hypothetical protein